MGKNSKKKSTITRSISFKFEVLAALDVKCAEFKMDRSTYIGLLLEHKLGLTPQREIMGKGARFIKDQDRVWLRRAVDLGYDIPPVNPPKTLSA